MRPPNWRLRPGDSSTYPLNHRQVEEEDSGEAHLLEVRLW